jgi:hypothetical protein
MPTCDPTSSAAPASDRLRTTQHIDMSPNLIKPGSRTRRRLVFRASAKSMTVILGVLLIEVTPVCGRRCTGHIKTSVNLEPTDSDFHLWITDRVLEPSCKSDADATYCPPVYAVFFAAEPAPRGGGSGPSLISISASWTCASIWPGGRAFEYTRRWHLRFGEKLFSLWIFTAYFPATT